MATILDLTKQTEIPETEAQRLERKLAEYKTLTAPPEDLPATSPVPPAENAQRMLSAPGPSMTLPPDADLLAAQQERRKSLAENILLAGSRQLSAGALGIAGQTHVKNDMSDIDTMNKQAELPIMELQEKRAAADFNLKQGLEQKASDPNSEVSRTTRNELKRMFNVNVPDTASALDLSKSMNINLGSLIGIHEQALARKEAARESAGRTQDMRDMKKEQRVEDKTEKFAGKIQALAAAQNTINEIDNLIDLEKKKGSVPGYGPVEGTVGAIPIIGEIGAKSIAGLSGEGYQKAAAVRQAVQRLSNIELKDRSGAAVTPSEFERLQKELGTGAFKTEAELRNALIKMKKDLQLKAKGIEAGFGGSEGEVVQNYRKAGGSIGTHAIGKPEAAAPKTRIGRSKKDGLYYEVNEEDGTKRLIGKTPNG